MRDLRPYAGSFKRTQSGAMGTRSVPGSRTAAAGERVRGHRTLAGRRDHHRRASDPYACRPARAGTLNGLDIAGDVLSDADIVVAYGSPEEIYPGLPAL